MEVRLKQDLWNLDYDLSLSLPDEWDVEVLHMEGYNRRVLAEDDYRQALEPLATMMRGKKEICVLFDDLSRPTRAHKITPFLMEIFEKAGIRDEQVRFICALGTHAPLDNSDFRKKLGEWVLERYPVYNHNPYENCLNIGKTQLGTPVMVNRDFLECDFRIGIGSFLPHSFCGFGGGYKIVMPAISHIDAIEYHHGVLLGKYREKVCVIGGYRGNPLLDDLKEYGRIVGLDVKIDVLVNEKAENIDIYAGNPDALYEYMTGKAESLYRIASQRKADIVFTNCYAKANEGVIALSLAESFLKEKGGSVVVLCDIPGGQVVHYLLGRFGKDTWGRVKLGERQKDPRVKKIFIFSRYRDIANEWWYGKKEDLYCSNNIGEILEILQKEYAGTKPVVNVLPDGTIQTTGWQAFF